MAAKKKAAPVRVGVLGQGRSGLDIHCAWFRHSPSKYKLVAVADILRERRERAENELKCDAYADYHDLLARDDIELVVNSLPSHLHPQASTEALQTGHHVVCEKPLAWNVKGVDSMRRAAKQAGRLLMPFQQSRNAPHFQQLLQVIESGVLGRIIQINISYSGFARRWDWQTLQEFKGGNLLNTGPHPMDQAMRLLDFKKPRDIICTMDRANTFGDAEDHVKILVRTPGKPDLDIEITSCAMFARPMFTVYGTLGGLTGGPGGLTWKYYDPDRAPAQKLLRDPLPGPSYCREDLRLIEKKWEPNKTQKNAFGYMSKLYYDHLFDVLRNGVEPAITPEQVRTQIAVIEECHRQNKLSRRKPKGWPAGN